MSLEDFKDWLRSAWEQDLYFSLFFLALVAFVHNVYALGHLFGVLYTFAIYLSENNNDKGTMKTKKQ